MKKHTILSKLLIISLLCIIVQSCNPPGEGELDDSLISSEGINEDSIRVAGGESVGNYPPPDEAPTYGFHSANTGFKSSHFQFHLMGVSGNTIGIEDLKITGVKSGGSTSTRRATNSDTKFVDIDLEATKVNEISPDNPLIIELRTSEPIAVKSLQIKISKDQEGNINIPTDFALIQDGVTIMKVNNLTNTRPDIWVYGEWITFAFPTEVQECDSGFQFNHLGECVPTEVWCNEITDQFNTKIKPCSVKVDGKEKYCYAKPDQGSCMAEVLNTSDLCNQYHRFLTSQNQIIEAYFDDQRFVSQVCGENSNLMLDGQTLPTVESVKKR